MTMAISQRGRLSRGTRCRSAVLASDALQKRQVVDLRLCAMAPLRVACSQDVRRRIQQRSADHHSGYWQTAARM